MNKLLKNKEKEVIKSDMKTMRQLLEWQLAWLAGLIDGEGCIGIHQLKNRGSTRARITLTLSSTCLSVIDFIYTLTGIGNVTYHDMRKSKSLGTLPQKRWYVTNVSEMRGIMIKLLPYLFVKAPQARMMLEFCNGKFSGNPVHDDSYYYEMTKTLNHSITKVNINTKKEEGGDENVN